ncbi:Uncharacterised protein [Gordonia terrae]|nr:Uncharacterised protein [Clostridioides difficile]VTS18097.1 Uncharacterised protein [Gordonia terrae]
MPFVARRYRSSHLREQGVAGRLLSSHLGEQEWPTLTLPTPQGPELVWFSRIS